MASLMDIDPNLVHLAVMQHNKPAIASVREVILNDLAYHAQATINLKTRLNSLTPIGWLPPEMLSNIFVMIAKAFHYNSYNDFLYHPSPLDWLKVSHVCHHWRAVALSTPQLWSHLQKLRPDVFSQLIERSRTVPLFVDTRFEYLDPCKEILTIICKESHRLQELVLQAGPRDIQFFCENLSARLESLETIDLTARALYSNDTFSSQNGPTFPLVPPQCSIPRLRYLVLQKIPFSWSDRIFCPSLVSLTVTARYSHRADNLGVVTSSFESLLAALKPMAPALQVLRLEHVIPHLPGDTTLVSPVIIPSPPNRMNLPSLRSMTLIDSTIACANLLHHLAISPSATLSLTGSGDAGAQELVRGVSQHAAHMKPLLWVDFGLMSNFEYDLAIRGWPTLVPQGFPALDFGIKKLSASSPAIMQALLKDAMLLLRPVQHLLLHVGVRMQAPPWKSIFSSMTHVHTLVVLEQPRDGFFPALCDVPRVQTAYDRSWAPFVPLPCLRVLKLNNARFRGAALQSLGGMRSRRTTAPQGSDGVQFFDRLLDWAIMRCNYGLPIDELHLENITHATGKDIAVLEGVVPEVQWDHWEKGMTDEEEEEDDSEDDYYDDEYYGYGYNDSGDDFDDEDVEEEDEDVGEDEEIEFHHVATLY